MAEQWNHKIFGANDNNFTALAIEIFQFQYANNAVYKAFVDALGIVPASVTQLSQVPFLPIRFFKSHVVKTTEFEPLAIFESSGTTGRINSHHYVRDISLYEESFLKTFNLFYGNVENYTIFALLPSYLERGNSSLVYMVEKLVKLSGNKHSRFYLDNVEEMMAWIRLQENYLDKPAHADQKNLLIGVTYALLDSMGDEKENFKNTIIMETGGMKGRRKEMVRPEVHQQLQQAFGVDAIHSEYGMTELLSQAYSSGHGIFNCPPWMKILVRDEEDPLQVKTSGAGLVNVIDLANIYSCCFIATDDVGKLYENGSFEILGRMDGSDIRGCSLLTV